MEIAKDHLLLHKLTQLAVILALAVKLVVPAGFMLASSAQANGFTAITLCTSAGTTKVWMDETGAIVDAGKPAPKKDKKLPHEQPCSAGCHANVLHEASCFVTSTTAIMYQTVSFPVHAGLIAPGSGLAAPPPPSQGPPLNV